ncbi:uncharacterized protein At4g18490-like isoform X2 [Phragmites australis]|uniref:uncharacterized protein At4g18490-like isoform X2 n=1 Tax=Phragmites australis TaxID=29695 RepID=UPI002D76FFB1|nr:uncharacterized protein At4g18490-like isoform X2 [Phragmites australis]
MDESRKRSASTANAKNMSSSLDEDFGNDFISPWKLPKSGEDTIDFNVESVPKSSKKFSFDSLDDFGLDGVFDKLSPFKMGMSALDFSSPIKKKVKHNSSNGDDLSEGKKETEKDNFSFSFDFNELGKLNLDAKLGIEEKSMSRVTGKTDPVSSEGNKDTQRGISTKGTDVREDNKSKEQTQTQDACTLRPYAIRQESVKNGSRLTSNVNAADSSDEMQEHTRVSRARMEQTNIDPVSNHRHGEHSKEAYPTKAAVNKSSQKFSCSAVSVEDPTQVQADPVNSKEAPKVDFSKVHMSRESNDNEQSISSQSRNTSTVNPYISRRSLGQLDAQNEVMEENAYLNEGSQGNQSFSGTPKKFSKKISCGTKNSEEGTSAPKSLSLSMRREIRNVKPTQVNETGSFSLLSKSANMKPSRIELASETTLNQLAGASKVIKKMTAHPTDLKREHKQANDGTDKSKNALSKTYIKPALHGLLTTSMNFKDDRNAKLGLEPPSAGNLSLLNTQSSRAPSTEHKIVPNHVLRKSSNDSDSLQGTPSKDDKIPTISQLTGRRIAKLGIRSPKCDILLEKESVEVSGSKGSPVTTSKILNSVPIEKPALASQSIMQKESVLDPKAPTVLKHIMGSPAVRKSRQTVPDLENPTILGTPKAHVDNVISSVIPCEMGDISDLELPVLLENDGNIEKAEACRKELEDICILLKRKHTEAKELAVRAIVNNNMMLILNHPMFEEKISSLRKFANGLTSKKYLFEEVGTIDAH